MAADVLVSGQSVVWFYFLALIPTSLCAGGTPLDELLKDPKSCSNVCIAEFPSVIAKDSCQRGCRFSDIAKFMDPVLLENEGKTCKASCNEAYAGDFKEHSMELISCLRGCEIHSQNDMNRVKSKETQDGDFRMQIGFGMPRMADLIKDVFGQMQSRWNLKAEDLLEARDQDIPRQKSEGPVGVAMSWSTYVSKNNDGDVAVVKSPVRIVEFGARDRTEDSEQPIDPLKPRVPEEGYIPSRVPAWLVFDVQETNTDVSRRAENTIAGPVDASKAVEASIDDDKDIVVVPASQVSGGGDWLACISRKSGLPRWLLVLTIVLSVVVMLYLCLSTTVTSPRRSSSYKKMEEDEDVGRNKKLYWIDVPLDDAKDGKVRTGDGGGLRLSNA